MYSELIRGIAYWFRNPRMDGRVRKAGYILADGSHREINLTVWDNRTPPLNAVGYTLECPVNWVAHAYSALLGHELSGTGVDPEAAIKDLAEKISEQEEKERAVRNDPSNLLERELSRHDWWACMSDSYGAELAANKHLEEVISPILKSMDPEVAREIWSFHAPKEFPCPV